MAFALRNSACGRRCGEFFRWRVSGITALQQLCVIGFTPVQLIVFGGSIVFIDAKFRGCRHLRAV
jgi:hypothetical protein